MIDFPVHFDVEAGDFDGRCKCLEPHRGARKGHAHANPRSADDRISGSPSFG